MNTDTASAAELIEGSFYSLVLFFAVVFSVLSMLFFGALQISKKFARRFSILVVFWVGSFSIIVASGLIEKNIFPSAPLAFAAIITSAIILGLSSDGKELSSLPFWYLVFFQSFRLPLEVVLHLWADSETIPPTMTWTGQNPDIISGVLALGAALPAARTKAYSWTMNIVGILLLINVIRVVVMSSPLPFAWDLERPIILILFMPYAMIGFVCVWAAIFGHIVLTRALLK